MKIRQLIIRILAIKTVFLTFLILPEEPLKTDVLIVGTGPAGLCAAIHTARACYKTVVFGQDLGQLAQASRVENWPCRGQSSGLDILGDLRNQAEHFGAIIEPEAIDQIDSSVWPFKAVSVSNTQIEASSIIIATGGIPQKLAIPGVEKYWGKGISICPICDGPFDKDKEVAVIGDDDTAADKALRLANFAHHVYIIVEGKQMTAHAIALSYISETPNISILPSHTIEEIVGNDCKVTGLKLLNKISQNKYILPIQSIYFALGFNPNSSLAKDQIQCNTDGYILTFDNTQKTSVKGIFAAGTVEDNRYQKAANNAGRGVQAGLDAINFLQEMNIEPQQPTLNRMKQELRGYAIPSLTDDQDIEHILQNHDKKIVALDFYISNCPDCIFMAPIIESVVSQLSEQIACYKIDYETCPQLVNKFTIEEVPCMLIFKEGTLIDRLEGKMTKKELLNALQK